jgi:hypothetical protein
MMNKARLVLICGISAAALGACVPYGSARNSYADDRQFTEPTFFSVQPVAYPHPTGCEMCGFPDRLGSPQQ